MHISDERVGVAEMPTPLAAGPGFLPGVKRRIAEDAVMMWVLRLATVFAASAILFVIVFVVRQALPLIKNDGLAWLVRGGWDTSLEEAWANGEYWGFGIAPLIAGTFLTTVGALVFASIIGTGAAVFLAELAPAALRRPVEAVVRLLAGVPSVVFGLVGLTVLVPWLQRTFISDEVALRFPDVPLDGQSLVAGVAVLTFMVLPFYVTVATDALRAVPRSYREGGLALGMSRWRSVTRIVLPAATAGLVAGLVLAAARAVGEAIALSMVAGAMAWVPRPADGLIALLEPVRTMASAIVENGEGLGIPSIEAALFGLASVLLVVSLVLSVGARLAFGWFQRRMGMVSDRAV